jgi:hypothetical protein
MLRTAIVAATNFPAALSDSTLGSQWRRFMLALVLSAVFMCLPTRGHTAGLDCPEIGPAAVPNLFSDLQLKLVSSGNTIDLTNEIYDVVNKLQVANPNISYTELTNVMLAAYCPVVANMSRLTAAEKWSRMRQFESILQRQLAANMLSPGTLIVANVPLPPPVYRELRSQAATSGQSPAQLMAAILSRAAGN